MDDLKEATKRRVSFTQTMKAMFWSFFEVRKGRDHGRDMAQLNSVHVIVADILVAIISMVALLMIVRAVVGWGLSRLRRRPRSMGRAVSSGFLKK